MAQATPIISLQETLQLGATVEAQPKTPGADAPADAVAKLGAPQETGHNNGDTMLSYVYMKGFHPARPRRINGKDGQSTFCLTRLRPPSRQH